MALMYDGLLDMALPEPPPEAEFSMEFMYSLHAPVQYGTSYDHLVTRTDYQPITLLG